jgi:hypothetical protein
MEEGDRVSSIIVKFKTSDMSSMNFDERIRIVKKDYTDIKEAIKLLEKLKENCLIKLSQYQDKDYRELVGKRNVNLLADNDKENKIDIKI